MPISINIVIGQPSYLFLYIYNKQIVDAIEVRRAVETHRVQTGVARVVANYMTAPHYQQLVKVRSHDPESAVLPYR
jgi:hypothetical protein